MATRISLVSWLNTLLIASLSLSFVVVVAQEDLQPRQDPHQNYFTNPPQASVQYDYQDDPAYDKGTKVNVTWETGLPSVDLILCQPALDGSYGQSRLVANTSQRWFLWDVTYSDVTTLAGPVGNAFFFQFRPPAAAVPFYNSHYFNVTDPKPGSENNTSTSTSASSTPSSTNISSNTAPNSDPANPTGSQTGQSNSLSSSSASSSSSSSDISTGAVAAISVCAALATCAFTALLTLILVRRQKQRNAEKNKIFITETAMNSQSSTSIGGPPQEMTATSPAQEIGSRPSPHEIEATERPVELEAEIVGQAM